MTIHVNIGEAKAQLSKLVAAALRGEKVILDKAGLPQVELVPTADARALIEKDIKAKRENAFGKYAEKYAHLSPEAFDVSTSMTDEEYEARIQSKFG